SRSSRVAARSRSTASKAARSSARRSWTSQRSRRPRHRSTSSRTPSARSQAVTATTTATSTATRTPSASAGVSAAGRGRMDERVRTPGDGPYADRAPFDWLGALLGPRIDELRALLDELAARWRGDAVRVGEGTRHRLRDLFRELGLVTRDDWDELELR